MSESRNPIKMVMDITGMSQDSLAKNVGITRQTLANYITSPEKIPVDVIIKLSMISGYSVDKLVKGPEKLAGPELEAIYESKSEQLNVAIKNGYEGMNVLSMFKSDDGTEIIEACRNEVKDNIKNILHIAELEKRKAVVCCFGASDSGKSSLNNMILGEDVIPADYAPLTSTTVVIHHISEKPEYLGALEDSIVFGRKSGDEEKLERYSFIKNDINSKYENYIIREGDHKSILDAFSVRTGAYYKNNEFIIDEIHIFLDKDILKELTLVDIPGFHSGEVRDDVALTMEMAAFDLIIYLSQADAFLRGDDIVALQQILRSRETLDSVLIVATHCDAIGDPAKVEKICHEGCLRLIDAMVDSEIKRLGGESALNDRFFAFDLQNKPNVDKFNREFERLVPQINQKNIENAWTVMNSSLETLKTEFQGRMDDIQTCDHHEISDEEISAGLERITQNHERLLSEMQAKINLLQNEDRNKYEEAYNKIINRDFLNDAISNRCKKNNRESRDAFLNYINSKLNASLTSILEKSSREFSEDLSQKIVDFSSFLKTKENDSTSINISSFDSERAFASGLVGVTTYGALATWATIVAGGSNLGAYILTAKVVSALSALGISLGGTGAVAAALASIGGPVTIGVGIAVIAASATYGILSGNWKSRLITKTIEEYQKNDTCQKGLDAIDSYWKNTDDALQKCAEKLREDCVVEYKNKAILTNIDNAKQVKIDTGLMLLYENAIILCNSVCDTINLESR